MTLSTSSLRSRSTSACWSRNSWARELRDPTALGFSGWKTLGLLGKSQLAILLSFAKTFTSNYSHYPGNVKHDFFFLLPFLRILRHANEYNTREAQHNEKFLLIALLLALAGAAGISADVRTEPIDVIVALDKSLSMVEEIGAVVEYVNTYIIDQLLIPGDYFLVLAFYGKTEIPVAMRITGDADKQKAKQAVAALAANGRFTDIGNALDVLGAELAKLPEQNRRKHLLLITDGIQEAPPASRYYSRDGKFTHEFLESTKTIQKQGWKIEILGIGTHTGAGELAENLAAGYTELSDAPTAQEFIEKTRGFLSSVEITEGPRFLPFNSLGRGRLHLGLTSRGHEQAVTLELSGIRLSLEGGTAEQDILRRPLRLTVAPGAPLQASLPLRLKPRLPVGEYRGEIRFTIRGRDPVHSRCHAGRLSGKILAGWNVGGTCDPASG